MLCWKPSRSGDRPLQRHRLGKLLAEHGFRVFGTMRRPRETLRGVSRSCLSMCVKTRIRGPVWTAYSPPPIASTCR